GFAGVIVAAIDRRTRSIVWLLAGILLRGFVLFLVAARHGADRPYLALKMAYLVIYPLSVAAALTLATVAQAARQGYGAWVVVSVIAIFVIRPLIAEPRPQPIVS